MLEGTKPEFQEEHHEPKKQEKTESLNSPKTLQNLII